MSVWMENGCWNWLVSLVHHIAFRLDETLMFIWDESIEGFSSFSQMPLYVNLVIRPKNHTMDVYCRFR